MPTVTLNDMRTEVRRYLNEPLTTGLLSDDMIRSALNKAQKAVHHEMLQQDDNYLVEETDLSMVAGQEKYPLTFTPEDVRILSVQVIEGAVSDVYPLEFIPLQDRWKYIPTSLVTFGGHRPVTRYYLQGDEIGILPPPVNSSPAQVRIWYVPLMGDLVSGTDVITLPDEFAEWITLEGALRALTFIKEDRPDIRVLRDEERARMIRMADTRTVSEPRMVRFVDPEFD